LMASFSFKSFKEGDILTYDHFNEMIEGLEAISKEADAWIDYANPALYAEPSKLAAEKAVAAQNQASCWKYTSTSAGDWTKETGSKLTVKSLIEAKKILEENCGMTQANKYLNMMTDAQLLMSTPMFAFRDFGKDKPSEKAVAAQDQASWMQDVAKFTYWDGRLETLNKELNKGENMNFKVGDRFECLIGVCGVKEGDICRLIDSDKTQPGCYILYNETRESSAGTGWALGKSNWKKLSAEQSEVQDLIDQMNKGVEAEAKIRDKYKGDVEFTGTNRHLKPSWFTPLAPTTQSLAARLKEKPKPVFEQFTTQEGHLVTYKDDVLQIGCIKIDGFMNSGSLQDLNRVLNEGFSSAGGFSCRRKGIAYVGDVLNYADAEVIYRRLKEINP